MLSVLSHLPLAPTRHLQCLPSFHTSLRTANAWKKAKSLAQSNHHCCLVMPWEYLDFSLTGRCHPRAEAEDTTTGRQATTGPTLPETVQGHPLCEKQQGCVKGSDPEAMWPGFTLPRFYLRLCGLRQVAYSEPQFYLVNRIGSNKAPYR